MALHRGIEGGIEEMEGWREGGIGEEKRKGGIEGRWKERRQEEGREGIIEEGGQR